MTTARPAPARTVRRRWYLLFALAVAVLEYAMVRVHASYPLRAVLALLLAFLALPLAWPGRWIPNYGNVRASLRLTWRVSLWFLGIWCVLLVVGALLVRANGWRFDVVLLNVPDHASILGYVLVAVVMAPVFEELVYRGVLLPPLRAALGRWPAILVNAMLFWMAHWVYADAVTLPNHLLAGVLFAWAYDRTGSLLAPTLLHALGNLWLGICDLAWLTWQDTFERLLGWQ